MKKINLIIIGTFLVFGIIMIAGASNTKIYDSDSKTITIKDNFGNNKAEIKLNSPINNYVGIGYQKVAELEFNSYEDFKGYLNQNDFELINISTNKKVNKKVNRKLDFKYLSYEDILTNSCKVNQITKESECSNVNIKGYVWKDISNYLFKSNEKVTIGIFTNTEKGDNIEWIPTFYGVQIDEWATWTADLNVDILSYYKLDESTGAVIDSLNLFNGTDNGATAGVNGIINTAYLFDGATNYITTNMTGSDIGDNQSFSVNAWFNVSAVGGINQAGTAIFTSDYVGFWLAINNPGTPYFIVGATPSTRGEASGGSISVNTWYMLTGVFDGSTIRLYKNGVSMANVSQTTTNLGTDNMTFGRLGSVSSDYVHGIIDEIGIWNRALTQSEITQLYNGGTGITYTNDFGSLSVDSLFPVSNGTTFNSVPINLTANITPSGVVGIANVSLRINGTINQTNSSGTIGLYNFSYINQNGAYNWDILAYGNDSNPYYSSNGQFIFVLDAPLYNMSVISKFPDNDYNSSNNNISSKNLFFVGKVTENNVDVVNVSLYINGTINQTNSSGLGGIYNFSVDGFENGYYNYYIGAYGNDSNFYNTTNGSINFFIDYQLNPPNQTSGIPNFTMAYNDDLTIDFTDYFDGLSDSNIIGTFNENEINEKTSIFVNGTFVTPAPYGVTAYGGYDGNWNTYTSINDAGEVWIDFAYSIPATYYNLSSTMKVNEAGGALFMYCSKGDGTFQILDSASGGVENLTGSIPSSCIIGDNSDEVSIRFRRASSGSVNDRLYENSLFYDTLSEYYSSFANASFIDYDPPLAQSIPPNKIDPNSNQTKYYLEKYYYMTNDRITLNVHSYETNRTIKVTPLACNEAGCIPMSYFDDSSSSSSFYITIEEGATQQFPEVSIVTKIAGYTLSFLPEADNLSFFQKLMITFVLVFLATLTSYMGLTYMNIESPTNTYLVGVIDVIFFILLASIGYIPIAIFLILLALIIGVAYLKR